MPRRFRNISDICQFSKQKLKAATSNHKCAGHEIRSLHICLNFFLIDFPNRHLKRTAERFMSGRFRAADRLSNGCKGCTILAQFQYVHFSFMKENRILQFLICGDISAAAMA